MSSLPTSPGIIYLGLDVHRDSVIIAVLPAGATAPTRIDQYPNDFAKLRRVFERSHTMEPLDKDHLVVVDSIEVRHPTTLDISAVRVECAGSRDLRQPTRLDHQDATSGGLDGNFYGAEEVTSNTPALRSRRNANPPQVPHAIVM